MKKILLLKSTFVIFSFCFINNTLFAQNITTTKSRCAKQKTSSISKKTYQKIELPPDYKPPVADKNSYTFRETFASKKQLKRINKYKKKKARGCAAAKF